MPEFFKVKTGLWKMLVVLIVCYASCTASGILGGLHGEEEEHC